MEDILAIPFLNWATIIKILQTSLFKSIDKCKFKDNLQINLHI
jgi:hypothetical protein